MERRMEPLEVRTADDGLIWIEQDQGQEDCGIAITPEQVPILRAWLEEAAAEIASRKTAAQDRS